MKLIDTHVHFDDDSFNADRDAAYNRAVANQVQAQIVPAIHVGQWEQVRDVCRRYPHLYSAYGLHPIFLTQHRFDHLEQLQQWIESEKPIAVGECGLDFYLKQLDVKQQLDFFAAQLQIAKDFDLPVIIHARHAVDAVIKQIRLVAQSRGVVHSFAGSEQQANQLINLGFYLGFGGTITYERAKRLHRLVKVLPLDSILLETDSPDQPLATRRGQRNEPAYLIEVLQTIAQLRQQPCEQIAAATTKNAITLFNLTLS